MNKYKAIAKKLAEIVLFVTGIALIFQESGIAAVGIFMMFWSHSISEH